MQLRRLLLGIALGFVLHTQAQQVQTFSWKAGIGGTSNDKPSDVAIDNMGNSYFGGGFQQTADFNSDSVQVNAYTSYGSFDGFVCKYNAQGIFQWVKRIGSNGNDNVVAIEVDAQNNVYVAGMFYNTIVLDSLNPAATATSNGFDDVFLAKFDASGNFSWIKSFGGFNADNLKDMTIDNKGNIVLIGNYANIVDFDPGAGISSFTAAGISDIYISKFNPQGDFLFVKTFGNANADEVGECVATDHIGNIFFAGEFNTSLSIANNGLAAVGMSDAFVVKLDSIGTEIWAKSFGGTDIEYAKGIAVDGSDFVLVSGSSRSTSVQFALGNATSIFNGNGLFDAYVVKFGNSGVYQWAQLFGDTLASGANTITVDEQNDIYTGGYFYGADQNFFGDSLSVGGGTNDQDAFVIKFKSNGTYQWVRKLGSPSLDEMVAVKFDQAQNLYYLNKTFGNPFDCDFGPAAVNYATAGSGDVVLVKYNHLCNLSAYITTNNFVLTAMPSLSTYQWINCDSNTVVAGQTSQQFTVTKNGNYAVVVTQGTCVDTSICINVTGLGIQQLGNDSYVQLIPNPANEKVIISSTLELKEVSILNVFGSVVYDEKVNTSKQVQLSTTGLAEGTYLVKLAGINGLVSYKKLVVVH